MNIENKFMESRLIVVEDIIEDIIEDIDCNRYMEQIVDLTERFDI